MKKLRLRKEIKAKLKDLLGIALVYMLIVGGIIVINARFEQLNQNKSTDEVPVQTVQSNNR